MIRNVKDVSSLLDRRFGSAVGRPWSFVRTIAWVLVGLYLFGVLIPAPKVDVNQTYYNRKLPTHAVRNLLTDKNDPRGFFTPRKDRTSFTIAWVGTSTLQNVGPHHYSFVPADVRNQLPTIDGKPVRIQMYLLEGGRTMDLYNVVRHAIASKPDLIMLDLNPLWVFNDRQLEEWSNLSGAVFGDLAGDPSTWPFLAALSSPKDAALSVADSHLKSLRDRWSYAEQLRQFLDQVTPLNPPKPDPGAKPPTPGSLAYVATMQSPLSFWTYFRPLVPSGSSTETLQRALLRHEKTDGSIINDSIVNGMLSSLASSRIPSIAYMPAIDPAELQLPGVDSALRRIENRLQLIADRHRAPTLLVKPQSATRTVTGLTFRDLVHMTYDPPMVDYLTGILCQGLTQARPSSTCTPTPSPR